MTGLSFEEYNEWRVFLKERFEDLSSSVHVINPGDYFSLEEVEEGGEEIQRRAMNFDLHKVRDSVSHLLRNACRPAIRENSKAFHVSHRLHGAFKKRQKSEMLLARKRSVKSAY